MFTLYLVCLIFGGILLGFSLISGSNSDHDADVHHGDFHADTDSSHLHLDSHDIHHHEIEAAHSSNGFLDEVMKFFSLRNIIYFISFFGLTGTSMNLLNFGSVSTLLSSLGVGGFASFFGYSLMKYLRKTESGETINWYNLKGKIATVSMITFKDKKGKILVECAGSTYEIPAILSDNSEYESLQKGEKIIIIEIDEKSAVIDKTDL